MAQQDRQPRRLDHAGLFPVVQVQHDLGAAHAVFALGLGPESAARHLDAQAARHQRFQHVDPTLRERAEEADVDVALLLGQDFRQRQDAGRVGFPAQRHVVGVLVAELAVAMEVGLAVLPQVAAREQVEVAVVPGMRAFDHRLEVDDDAVRVERLEALPGEVPEEEQDVDRAGVDVRRRVARRVAQPLGRQAVGPHDVAADRVFGQ
ncbi:hypothetical protein D9M72_254000 [compost metagenome]